MGLGFKITTPPPTSCAHLTPCTAVLGCLHSSFQALARKKKAHNANSGLAFFFFPSWILATCEKWADFQGLSFVLPDFLCPDSTLGFTDTLFPGMVSRLLHSICSASNRCAEREPRHTRTSLVPRETLAAGTQPSIFALPASSFVCRSHVPLLADSCIWLGTGGWVEDDSEPFCILKWKTFSSCPALL